MILLGSGFLWVVFGVLVAKLLFKFDAFNYWRNSFYREPASSLGLVVMVWPFILVGFLFKILSRWVTR